jgi:CRISPR-associated exonuclease Cas4
VEDVFGVPVQHGPVNYEDRSIQVDFTPSLRTSLLALLDEMHAAKQGEEVHIDHNRPGKCRSCGFRPVCGENLV